MEWRLRGVLAALRQAEVRTVSLGEMAKTERVPKVVVVAAVWVRREVTASAVVRAVPVALH